MELNSITKPKRRRSVNKPEWTKEKRKRLRIAGKEYINARGEVVAEKEPGPDCNCRRKCYERVPKATRMKLFKGYYSLKSHDEQNAYLFGLIRKVPIARKRAEGSTRRTCTFNYYIRIGGQETQVCVKALANIHGVGKSKIHILCEKLGQNVLFPRDERGRHSKMPKKVTDETVELAKQHIYSIIHTDRARDFLKDEKANNGPDVNITQMHKDFLDTYDPEYAQELIAYEKTMGHAGGGSGGEESFENQQYIEFRPNTLARALEQCVSDYNDQNETDRGQSIHVIMDSAGNAHQVLTTNPTVTTVNTQGHEQLQLVSPSRKKRKCARDGRPEPIMRQWFYSKIFHDIYTTKEAIALRKKVIGWKCTEDFSVAAKPMRKQRTPKKMSAGQQTVQHVIVQAPQEIELDPQDQQTHEQTQQVHLIQARLNKGTNTYSIPITTPHLNNKKIVHEVQLQNIPIKKKPVQVFQAQSQDMYSIYPMILQDLTQLDGHAVNLTHAQPLQQAQLRTIAPNHFQTVGQPVGTPMTITTGNLQALGVNINIAQPGTTHYAATPNGIMSYKFE